jgi:hypothetical protein
MGAGLAKGLGDSGTDSLRGPGHEDDLACEGLVHGSALLLMGGLVAGALQGATALLCRMIN